ncbi:tRNA uridine-5-carboxymethylaminomethyl(34) synthesis GTPase MnmE [Sphingomonas aracearum]|uniref:tRNA modification GTPase MnmE n=1 Tax=Sphingomonas aracearum TaxID=2283317 RepID=A0A369VU46_9SPHN|nr:tRNA uridine-5-carboxymethylaminomethyl(34) synthesis GTPase MnmE [Sphingomonas aracearum]RDE04592.1 tRNA uridine-5-carboxymethylaminomethyl(34) synthesis GTPase MnmE [Sphingomonas aracearum]
MSDTIYAVSSGQPPAAIAVIRISGRQAIVAAAALCGDLPAPRRAGVRVLRRADGAPLDEALVLLFPGPRTATGEDLVELQVHGGRAVIAAVLSALGEQPGLRQANAGEFTRRALLNGRLDLTQAEGLGDLLMAETEAQRRAAQQASEGGVRRQVEAWGERLLALSGQVEALIDHSDEGDVDAHALQPVREAIRALASELGQAAAQPPVEGLRDGVRVVLAGPPNAGKSSLLNALIGREAAIVSAQPGTTRDRIEAGVVRAGTAWLLTDTAGLRAETADPIEAQGVVLADAAMRAADLVIWLGDDPPPVKALWVHARADMPERTITPVGPDLAVSARNGTGLEALWGELEGRAHALTPALDRPAFNQRQRDLLHSAVDAIARAGDTSDILIVAEELRVGRLAFDRITGRADVEAVLDALFGQFCIGK